MNNQRQALLRVVFYKINSKPLSLDDYKNNVTVLSMHENAGETLLGTLKQVGDFKSIFFYNFKVFKRVLVNGHAEKVQMSNLLGELEEQLQSSLGGNDGTTGGETGGFFVCVKTMSMFKPFIRYVPRLNFGEDVRKKARNLHKVTMKHWNHWLRR